MKLADEDELPAPIVWTPPRGPPRRLRFSPCVASRRSRPAAAGGSSGASLSTMYNKWIN
jgi:hypothetical protein